MGSSPRGQQLELPFPLGRERPGVDERDAQLGAHQGEVASAKRTAVVDVKALGDPAAEDRPLKDGQKCGHGFAAREGRVGHDARGIVEQCDQIRLVPAPILGVEHGGGSCTSLIQSSLAASYTKRRRSIAGGGVGGPRRQAVVLEQAMHGGERERHVRRHELLQSRGRHDQRDAVGRVRFLVRAERIGGGLRESAGVALIGAGSGLEPVEAGAAIERSPAGTWSRSAIRP
jgi:hypothetical protein